MRSDAAPRTGGCAPISWRLNRMSSARKRERESRSDEARLPRQSQSRLGNLASSGRTPLRILSARDGSFEPVFAESRDGSDPADPDCAGRGGRADRRGRRRRHGERRPQRLLRPGRRLRQTHQPGGLPGGGASRIGVGLLPRVEQRTPARLARDRAAAVRPQRRYRASRAVSTGDRSRRFIFSTWRRWDSRPRSFAARR